MSKSKKAAKRKRQNDDRVELSHKKRVNAPPTPESSDGVERTEPTALSLHAVASEEEVEITVDTLRAVAAHPAVIKSKACKDLRTAVYDFRQACTTGVNTTGESCRNMHNRSLLKIISCSRHKPHIQNICRPGRREVHRCPGFVSGNAPPRPIPQTGRIMSLGSGFRCHKRIFDAER
jgi:hypothetical protein